MTQTTFFHENEADKFFQLLSDPRKEVKDFLLYDLLERTGTNLMYVDTDSVIFVDKDKFITKTLPIGNYLGQLTNEISPEDGHIAPFVSGGPKNYDFKTTSLKKFVK